MNERRSFNPEPPIEELHALVTGRLQILVPLSSTKKAAPVTWGQLKVMTGESKTII